MAFKKLGKWVGFVDLGKWADILARVGMYAACFLLMILILLMAVYIMQRQIAIRTPLEVTVWTFVEEWGGFMLVIITFLSLAYVSVKDIHIKIDVVTRLVPARVRVYLELFSRFVVLAIGIFILKEALSSFQLTWTAGILSKGPSRTPLVIPYIPMIVGWGLFILILVIDTVLKAVKARAMGKEGNRKAEVK